MTATFMVEVIYALPDQQTVKNVQVMPNTTVETAIKLSGILHEYPEINLSKNRFGIYSSLAQPETLLKPHDRIEIYRSLIIDPKEARRLRTQKK